MTKPIREAYGAALVKYGKGDDRVVVLDADVSSSTKSGIFQAACPERFFNCGVAEADMVGIAAGMAANGKIPFVNTFGVFLCSLGLASIRALCSYSKLPVKLMGAYGGLSDAFDGPSHHSIDDISIMRALPNMEVYVASDAVQTDWLVKNAIERDKPMYIRLSREAFPDLYAEGTVFEAGRGKIVREGCDAAVIACGLMVGNALAAAEMLQGEGISLRVVDMMCIKPLDEALVLRCAKETGAVITAEEHTMYGGLGGTVCEALCRGDARVPVGTVALMDTHAECGPYKTLQSAYGLDAAAIAKEVRATIAKK
ncbi:MAG: transketolase C-terminal domain-containing protein [Clostridia bacterium]|nr:transketolase C-terminal domain-containing protein [Clostridia bacterium]